MRARRVRSKGDYCIVGMLLQNLRRPGVGCVMGDPGPTTPAAQVFSGDVWKVEAGQFVSPLIVFTFSSSDCSTGKVFQQTPNERGTGPFPKMCLGNTGARSGRRQGPDIFNCYLALQLRIGDEPLLSRPQTFTCVNTTRDFTPSIPLFLSQKTISIGIRITRFPILYPYIKRLILDPYQETQPRPRLSLKFSSHAIERPSENFLQPAY